MAKNSYSEFFQQFFPKRLVQIQNGQKWPFQIFLTIFPKKTGTNLEWPKMAILNFSDYFSQKDYYKFRMAKNGHSKFSLTIFPKKTGINSEWPYQIFSDNFAQKDWHEFGMAKNGCSNFFSTVFPKKTGINSE